MPDPPRTLDDVRKLISRPFGVGAEDNTSETKDVREREGGAPAAGGLSRRLIVGSGGKHETAVSVADDSGRGNLMYLPPIHIASLFFPLHAPAFPTSPFPIIYSPIPPFYLPLSLIVHPGSSSLTDDLL